ncbi:MAG: ABC transporter permease [Lachnospiraceae bacterium]|nr:ABC transporter permease [Lachnospiraceae bacterium]
MIRYLTEHYELLGNAFAEHLWLVLVTLVLSLLVSALLSLVLIRSEKASNLVIQLFGVIYSIPSLALFAILIPVTGLGDKTAILVLCAYNQYLLLRNILTGMRNVDRNLLEAGTGMGMSSWQLLRTVQIPLAMPSILAGIRLSIISTTGITTIAAAIKAGGLGTVLFSGMRTMNVYKILWGTILCVVIALIADLGLKQIENRVEKKLGGMRTEA